MAGFGGFRPAAFQFLRDLARNNRANWFEANRDVYEREVREPMRRLVEADRLCRDFELLVPLVRWLNRALGYRPATTRIGRALM